MTPKNSGSGNGSGRGGGGGGRNRGKSRGGRGRGRGSGASIIRPSQVPKSSNSHEDAQLLSNENHNDNNHNNEKSNEPIDDDPSPHTVCLVCYSSDLPSHRTILPCGHDDICGPCHLRLRYLHSDRKCPVCKATHEKVIVDKDPPRDDDGEKGKGDGLDVETHTHKPFESYEMWGDELGAGYTYRDDVGMFFPTAYHASSIVPIFSLGCQVPNCTFTNESDLYITESSYNSDKPNARQKREVKRQSGMQALNTHLRAEHGLTLCDLCYLAKRDFVSNLPRFTPSQLKKHCAHGDGSSSGFTGHPLCEFCRPRRFYDLTKLHEHLNKEHYKCHICDKQGRPNQFFKNYNSLSRHFDREHFLCHHPTCLSARFVVFENEIALKAHERGVHGMAGSNSSKINLEFNVRGSRRGSDGYHGGDDGQEAPSAEDFQYGLDGEAFVPEALPNQNGEGGDNAAATPRQENEPEITHEAHAARTAELRAEAAQIRQAQRVREQGEAFPTLGGSTGLMAGGGTGGGMVGWTAEGRAGLGRRGKGQLTKEDFPALSTGPKKKSITAKAMRPSAPRMTPGSGSVQWSSSTPASRVPTSSQQSQAFFNSGSGIPINRQSNLAADNFPSLGGPIGGGAGAGGGSAGAYSRRSNAPQSQRSRPPTGADFPSLSATTPLSSQATSQKAAKERLLGAKKPPSQVVLNNTLDFPPPRASRDDVTFNDDLTSGKDTVRQMKAALGPTKYKELKRLTNYYAAGDMTPDGYVDMASALFDRGAGDACFWKFIPDLINSCPNSKDNAKAITYMENLRVADTLQKQEDNVASRNSTQAAVSGYAARSYGGRSEGYTPRVVPGKKKSSWKSSGNANTVRTKPPPGSVAAYAAAEEEALTNKPKAQQKQGGGNSRKAKAKKKNDELKSLAFGGK